jgi:MoCo/4Fe-4S cofactor protein with predicted Tat translocation signal
MSDDRHINFQLMRDHILSLQDADAAPRTGKKYWRSIEELADSPTFREFVAREFPQQAENWDDPVGRRNFLKLMGASLALAGLSGCVFQPPEKIVPYVKQPEETVPGKPLFFATAAPLFGPATPVLVRSNEGRPTKIEGNPDHPNNRASEFPKDDVAQDPRGSSATDIFTQASILGLYDPDRSQTLTYREELRTWVTFVGEMRTVVDTQRAKQGAGIRFLTESIISPSLGAQIRETLTAFPQAKWHQYEPVNRDNEFEGAKMAFGQPVNTIYRFDLAERVLSLDCDFLSAFPGYLRYARDFMARRRVTESNRDMNRLYVIETTPSNTGAKADNTWVVKPSEFEQIVRTFTSAVSDAAVGADWQSIVAKDLAQHKGAGIVIAGSHQPPAIHALAQAMNSALGNVGKTVFHTDPIEANWVNHRNSLQDLVNDLDAGRVELLVIIGGNPAYNAPADLNLHFERLKKAALRVHLSEYKDETSQLCHWHIPRAHYLESWGDTRSYDGTVTILQPLIEPLFDGKTAHELLAVFSDQYDRKPHDIVKQYWQRNQGQSQGQAAGNNTQGQGNNTQEPQAGVANQQNTAASQATADFETRWRQALHDGFIPDTALSTRTLSAQTNIPQQAPTQSQSTGIEVIFRPDPSIYDGRFANNGWLQELPKPLTKVTWDNAILISPNTAQQLYGVRDNGGSKVGREHYVPTVDLVDDNGRTARGPLWIMPGQPDNVLTVYLGYGRKLAGRVGNSSENNLVGFDAYRIRTSDAPWNTNRIQVRQTTEQWVLATTQQHFLLEDPKFRTDERDILRSQTLEQFLKGETEHAQTEHPHMTLYDESEYDPKKFGFGYAWGMAIDLNNCVGCNACTIACQSENNIPIVGKNEVIRSREMHWIRVDTYFKGHDVNHPEGTEFMPVPCMHCENAPCEPVCPVHATVHSAEGLNDMVYNRCVGTKYCSNNCPYKVRRFNFFLYNDWDSPTYQLMRNPDVSVRSRGVMEKCTYCVQRIQGAKIQSELEGRRVVDGEIVTACQAVCPTDAIVFGDVNDPNSRVSKLKANERNYSLLGELNTKPRTTYLSALRNPNPEIKG